jgi:hypothetical protein
VEFANLGNEALVSRLDNQASSTKSLGIGSSIAAASACRFSVIPNGNLAEKRAERVSCDVFYLISEKPKAYRRPF